jgi:hypothetical protein
LTLGGFTRGQLGGLCLTCRDVIISKSSIIYMFPLDIFVI